MTASTVYQWLILGALILTAGMWLGSIQTQVQQLQKFHDNEHGSYALPESR